MIILYLSRGSQEKRLWYPLNKRITVPQGRCGRFGEVTDPLPLPGIEGRFLGYAVRIKFLIYAEIVSAVKRPAER
jgi:hypothetical protein